jgi:hypothetical protein
MLYTVIFFVRRARLTAFRLRGRKTGPPGKKEGKLWPVQSDKT